MFSSRGTSAYVLAPNYAYQTGYSANYNDSCSGNTAGQLSSPDNVANGNYQQNLSCSWPVVYAVSNAIASRQRVLYPDDWVSINSNPCNYQNQPIGYNTYHLQRNNADVPPTNFSIQVSMDGPDGLMASRTDGLMISRTEGHPSPESAVAVSSDGLSGSESPELSLHLNQNSSGVICRPQPARSPFEWMKRTSYQSQPNPGKTRTKDKYRVVYTDHQRLELEKEFHYSRYITIRRKSELAGLLGLSERQVKIWFQNRRAKERKQAKKREENDQKSKDVLLHQTNTINISSLNFLRPLAHFDPENNNSRSIAMFQNGDHLCK